MSLIPDFNQLERFLTVTNKRETLVAANMANIDTPGYRTLDVDFQQTLNQAMLPSSQGRTHVAVRNVRGLLERPDGNNVDIDRESLLLAQSQLSYQLGTQLLKSSFHRLLSAIAGEGTAS